jgi:hypothetical protein
VRYSRRPGSDINHDGQRTSGLPCANGESELLTDNVDAPLLEAGARQQAKFVSLPRRGDVVEQRNPLVLIGDLLRLWGQQISLHFRRFRRECFPASRRSIAMLALPFLRCLLQVRLQPHAPQPPVPSISIACRGRGRLRSVSQTMAGC